MTEELNIMITADQIRAKVAELAEQIGRDYEGKPLLVVGVLKGAWVFLADLVRALPYPVKVDFIKVSSYGNATTSTGEVKFEMDFSMAVEGRDLLIVEDIVDTGVTLNYLKQNLTTRGPSSIRLCALLDKPERRKVDVTIDYRGFEIPDKFVVGYGLDCAENYRNLPFVADLTPDQADALIDC